MDNQKIEPNNDLQVQVSIYHCRTKEEHHLPYRREIWVVEYGDHTLDPEEIEQFVLDEFGWYTRFQILQVTEEKHAGRSVSS